MPTHAFTLFDTPIGRCAVAWNARGIAGVQLPEARDARTRARLVERFPGAREETPPDEVARAVDGVSALLRGERLDLSDVPLDLDGVPPFYRRVYETARGIPPGSTLTYGELAERLGKPGAARAVGQALGKNPFALVVPCHRVLAAGGRVGGFSAAGGITTKLRLLAIEGAHGAAGLFAGSRAPGFDADAALEHVRAADAALGRLIEKVGPFRMQLKATPDLFVALAEAIVYQQLTGKAAATIYARLCALFPRAQEGPTPRQIARATEARLRSAGLSRSKVLALKDLARRTSAGELPTLEEAASMDAEPLIEQLTAVRGIGRWTVEMLLMFRLGRPDVLPVDDYGIRKGFAVAFRKRELPSPREVATRGERWKPYRTLASWYLWRAAEL
jgi:methylated-DNA-[protein]-cysteine S-methyltransferase